MKYFEDVTIGDSVDLGNVTFDAAMMKSFAVRYDPQPFHVDDEAARQSPYKALIASGWQTAGLWMRCYVDWLTREAEAARARGEPVAQTGPALGFRDLKWLKPVYAGDTISYSSTVVDKKASASRPGKGLLMLNATGVNQNGEMVLSFVSTAFLDRRPAGP